MTKAVELAQVASTGVSEAFKNRIINGAMVISQRNGTSSVTPAVETYTLDRWLYNFSQASKVSIQQDAGAVTPPAGFTDYLGLTVVSSYSIGTNDYNQLLQPIEGFNTADLGWGTANAKTVTLSFWVRSSLTGTFGGSLRNANITRSYPFTYTISAANTWEYKTITVPGDTSGTWLTTNGIGILVNFSMGAGSGLSGTAGAWAGTNFSSATGAVSVVGTSGATFYITGVQLEVGSSATSFEYRSIGTELQLCERYYEKTGFGNIALAESGSIYVMNLTYRTTKRAQPSIGLYTTSNIRVRQFGVADRDAASPSATSTAGSTNGGYIKVSGFGAIGAASTPAGIGFTTSSENGDLFFASAEL